MTVMVVVTVVLADPGSANSGIALPRLDSIELVLSRLAGVTLCGRFWRRRFRGVLLPLESVVRWNQYILCIDLKSYIC